MLCATLMLTAACSPHAVEPAPLAGAQIGGPFTLVGADGRTVRDTDFAGKYRLVYFGYTFCPDVCPVDLNALMLGLKQFERQNASAASRVQPLFITVDPARDTPAVMGQYARSFHPRLIGLTGTAEQIADVARKYVITYARQPGATPDSYLVAHAQIAYLMGPDDKPIALIPVDDAATADVNEGSPDAVARALARWVR
ncbi:MAG: SCO family protein [Sphingopyxis sp.]